MELGDFWLDNVELYEGNADRLYREYEGGLVLLNAAWEPYTFNLDKISHGKSYRRINGTQDRSVNNGKHVGNTITLQKMDGIILVRA